MRAAGHASLRCVATALALAAGLIAAAGGDARAEKIGALDSFFQTGETQTLQPAPLAPAGAVVMAPSGARPAGPPRVEMLLDAGAGDGPAGATILSEAARRALAGAPAEAALRSGLEDPLLRRDAVPAAPERQDAGDRLRRLLRGAGTSPAAPRAQDTLARLFAGDDGPLSQALNRRDDPIRAGALLASSREAALDPSLRGGGEAQETLPPVGGFGVDPDALDRRMLLIGLALAAAVVAGGATIFAFAPTGGTTLRRR